MAPSSRMRRGSGDGTTGGPPADGVTGTWEVRADGYAVPAQETTYRCFPLSVSVDGLAHMIAFEPIVDDPAVVHHILLLSFHVLDEVLAECHGLALQQAELEAIAHPSQQEPQDERAKR